MYADPTIIYFFTQKSLSLSTSGLNITMDTGLLLLSQTVLQPRLDNGIFTNKYTYACEITYVNTLNGPGCLTDWRLEQRTNKFILLLFKRADDYLSVELW